MPLEFVTALAFNAPSELGPLARAAEQAGFDCVCLSDHLVHPEQIRTPYPYTPDGQPRWEPFTDWPDPWVAFASMAAVTERIRFYTSVYVLAMRNPIAVAKTVGTTAVLSGGRVALGVGAGWMKDEFLLMGQDFHTRGRRMDEMIDVLRKLWAGGWVEHHGEFYDFDRLEMSPVPPAPVPIWVGGVSKPALRRAATLGDGWISDLHAFDELAKLVAEVKAMRADSPRHADPFPILVSCTNAIGVDGYKRLEGLGISHVVTIPWLFYGADPSRLEEKIEGARRFGEDVIEAFR